MLSGVDLRAGLAWPGSSARKRDDCLPQRAGGALHVALAQVDDVAERPSTVGDATRRDDVQTHVRKYSVNLGDRPERVIPLHEQRGVRAINLHVAVRGRARERLSAVGVQDELCFVAGPGNRRERDQVDALGAERGQHGERRAGLICGSTRCAGCRMPWLRSLDRPILRLSGSGHS